MTVYAVLSCYGLLFIYSSIPLFFFLLVSQYLISSLTSITLDRNRDSLILVQILNPLFLSLFLFFYFTFTLWTCLLLYQWYQLIRYVKEVFNILISRTSVQERINTLNFLYSHLLYEYQQLFHVGRISLSSIQIVNENNMLVTNPDSSNIRRRNSSSSPFVKVDSSWRRLLLQLSIKLIPHFSLLWKYLKEIIEWILEDLKSTSQTKTISKQEQQNFIRYLFHEIRVPLNSISLGLTELSKQNKLQIEEKELLDLCINQTEATTRILNDVLSLQKIEEGKLELKYSPFSLNGLLGNIIQSFQLGNSCRDKHIRIKSQFASVPEFAYGHSYLKKEERKELPSVDVVGDELRLGQIITNLLSNAIKFSTNEGEILIKTEIKPLTNLTEIHHMKERIQTSFSQQEIELGMETNKNIYPKTLTSFLYSSSSSSSDYYQPLVSPLIVNKSSTSTPQHITHLQLPSITSTPNANTTNSYYSSSSWNLPNSNNKKEEKAINKEALEQLSLFQDLLESKSKLINKTALFRISVIDYGIGITSEVEKKLFEPCIRIFSSPEDQKNQIEGSGLGLKISKSLIELHGGKIGFIRPQQDETQTGSEFYIELPLFLLERSFRAFSSPSKVERKISLSSIPKEDSSSNNNTTILFSPIMPSEELIPSKKLSLPLSNNSFSRLRSLEEYPNKKKEPEKEQNVQELIQREIKQQRETKLQISIPSLSNTSAISSPFQISKTINRQKSINSNYKILVVEDNQANRKLLVKMLERNHYQVTSVEDGSYAVNLFMEAKENKEQKEWPFHLILMDNNMPKMSGISATKQLVQMGVTQKVPIIGVTANVMKEDVDAFLQAGASQVIGKPIREKQILNVINQYLCNFGKREELSFLVSPSSSES